MNDVRTLVDIGCGDWSIMRAVDLVGISYRGFDVVADLVHRNQQAFGSDDVAFAMMTEDLSMMPDADVLLIKDVLQHLPDSTIRLFAERVFPKYRACLITNSFEKIHTDRNTDIEAGGFRCLDLRSVPYNLAGSYVFEYWAQPWERIRTLLLRSRQ